MFDHVEQVDQLLNSKDSDGNAILHLAVAQKRVQIVKYLVGEKIEVDINAPNNGGCTSLDLQVELIVGTWKLGSFFETMEL